MVTANQTVALDCLIITNNFGIFFYFHLKLPICCPYDDLGLESNKRKETKSFWDLRVVSFTVLK